MTLESRKCHKGTGSCSSLSEKTSFQLLLSAFIERLLYCKADGRQYSNY